MGEVVVADGRKMNDIALRFRSHLVTLILKSKKKKIHREAGFQEATSCSQRSRLVWQIYVQ